MTGTVRRFVATVGTKDRGDLMVAVPFDVRAVFGRARPPVVVTVKRFSYRSTVSVYGGEYFLPMRKSHREAAGVRVGERVTMTVAADDAPRVVKPPPDLARALAKSARLRAAWDALSFSAQRERAEAVAGAKKPETRERRLGNVLADLERRRLRRPSSIR